MPLSPKIVCSVAALCATFAAHTRSYAEPGRLGMMADLGVPDGAMASLVVRPQELVHLHVGLGYNLIGPGVRIGGSVAPIRWWITPTVNVEAGHYFSGDANKAVAMFDQGNSGEPQDSPVLREVGYQFANFHLGIELGGSRATFTIHAGMSAIRGTIHNLDEQLADDSDDGMDGPTVEVREDPVVRLWVPSARAGLVIFF